MFIISTLAAIIATTYIFASSLAGGVLALALNTILLLWLLLIQAPYIVAALVMLAAVAITIILMFGEWRLHLISSPALKFFIKNIPPLTVTEEVALKSGKPFWEAKILAGKLELDDWLARPRPKLTDEEQQFIDGPVHELCKMLDDWQICQNDKDLPPNVWKHLKESGFFGLIIPKKYGGKEFSAFLHSEICSIIAGKSLTAATLVTVPNSLGPGELLCMYGTEEQKERYLPKLARGEHIPCFGLTGPWAGSDATAIPDKGIVCKGTFDGKEVLGLKLNWDKRYITYAPIATLLGLAFNCYDPDGLLGEKVDLGITVALIPTDLPGISKGKRHLPLGVPFQNGPIRGRDVFIPLDYIIGGQEQIGNGWKMLMECLAVGRAISLPSTTIGSAKVATFVSGAYARVREQFKRPISNFEGIQEQLALMGAYTYIGDSTRGITAHSIDCGEKPAIAGAISKYHVTEFSRKIGQIGMDIMAGKAVMMGPSNPIARHYQGAGIGITVEGANILTRNLIIFGQGLMRAHPYLLKELNAAQKEDLVNFDKYLFRHIRSTYRNGCRAFIGSWGMPSRDKYKSHPHVELIRKLNHATYCLAFLTDVVLIVYGGKLKVKEFTSARMGDAMSNIYMALCVLKRFENDGRPPEDEDLVTFCLSMCINNFWDAIDEIKTNFPSFLFGLKIKTIIFAKRATITDVMRKKIAETFSNPNPTRKRLTRACWMAPEQNNPIYLFNSAMWAMLDAEPILKRYNAPRHWWQHINEMDLNEHDKRKLHEAKSALFQVIQVDEFEAL